VLGYVIKAGLHTHKGAERQCWVGEPE